jgi:hypothetical protein
LAFGHLSLGDCVEALADTEKGGARSELLHSQDHLVAVECSFDVYLDECKMEHSREMENEALA